MENCNDSRFDIIKAAKMDLINATNIETSPEEMSVLDRFLFRCWQMGWLNSYEPSWYQRLINERDELAMRIKKLEKYISSALPEDIYKEQYDVMCKYLDILNRRIEEEKK